MQSWPNWHQNCPYCSLSPLSPCNWEIDCRRLVFGLASRMSVRHWLRHLACVVWRGWRHMPKEDFRWGSGDWSFFTDESRFTLFRRDGWRHVNQHRGDRLDDASRGIDLESVLLLSEEALLMVQNHDKVDNFTAVRYKDESSTTFPSCAATSIDFTASSLPYTFDKTLNSGHIHPKMMLPLTLD